MSMPTCPSCVYAQGICEKTGVKIRHSTGCTYHTPKRITKADRIRSMTDEELADWLGVYCNGQTAQEVGKPCVSDMGSCEECWLDWLKQEAKE